MPFCPLGQGMSQSDLKDSVSRPIKAFLSDRYRPDPLFYAAQVFLLTNAQQHNECLLSSLSLLQSTELHVCVPQTYFLRSVSADS